MKSLSAGLLALLLSALSLRAQGGAATGAADVQRMYAKREVRIAMRDGVELFTSIYTPRDTTKPLSDSAHAHALWRRAVRPGCVRGEPRPVESVSGRRLHLRQPGHARAIHGGGYYSFMTPYIENKKSNKDVDESSDTYDTIDWLIKNIPHNNGRVGSWGNSAPGFFVSAGMIDAHPALKAAYPSGADDRLVFRRRPASQRHADARADLQLPQRLRSAARRADDDRIRRARRFATPATATTSSWRWGRTRISRRTRCRDKSRSGIRSWRIRTTTPSGRSAASGSTRRTSRPPCSRWAAGSTPRIRTALLRLNAIARFDEQRHDPHDRHGSVDARRLEPRRRRLSARSSSAASPDSIFRDSIGVSVLQLRAEGSLRRADAEGDHVRDGREQLAHVRRSGRRRRSRRDAVSRKRRRAVVHRADGDERVGHLRQRSDEAGAVHQRVLVRLFPAISARGSALREPTAGRARVRDAAARGGPHAGRPDRRVAQDRDDGHRRRLHREGDRRLSDDMPRSPGPRQREHDEPVISSS